MTYGRSLLDGRVADAGWLAQSLFDSRRLVRWRRTVLPLTGFLKKFKHEFLEHIEGKCSVGKSSPVLSTAAH